METVFNLNTKELLAFALVLLRMSGFVVTMPVIGSSSIAPQTKVLFALALTFVIFPTLKWTDQTVDLDSLAIVTLIIKELFIGLSFGFLARMFFNIIAIAGQIMSVSMGLASAQLFNPTMGETSTALDQFYLMLASIFFLLVNGHHALIEGIFASFQMIPIHKMSIQLAATQHMGQVVHDITVMGLKFSAPILVAILFMNIAVAVVGRAVPQINILITSLSVNSIAGLAVMFVCMPLMVWQMDELLTVTTTELFRFIKAL